MICLKYPEGSYWTLGSCLLRIISYMSKHGRIFFVRLPMKPHEAHQHCTFPISFFRILYVYYAPQHNYAYMPPLPRDCQRHAVTRAVKMNHEIGKKTRLPRYNVLVWQWYDLVFVQIILVTDAADLRRSCMIRSDDCAMQSASGCSLTGAVHQSNGITPVSWVRKVSSARTETTCGARGQQQASSLDSDFQYEYRIWTVTDRPAF
jgi:hypothetical protein